MLENKESFSRNLRRNLNEFACKRRRKNLMDTYLNDEGKKHWSSIFPDAIVPVKSPFAQDAEVEQTGDPLNVYIVDWTALSDEQRQAILQKLSSKFNVSVNNIELDILKTGLPLQSKYVSSVSIPMRFLI
jgi:hypothetical protein